MGQIIHPNAFDIKGPWLLDRDDFKQLEKIIAEIKTSFKASLDFEIEAFIKSSKINENLSVEQIQEEVNKAAKKYPFDRIDNSCYFKSKDNTKLLGVTLNDILKDANLNSFSPNEFYSYIRYGDNNKFTIEINRYNGRLSYELQCFDEQIGNELKDQINQWIETKQPKRFVRLWSNWGDLLTVVLPLIIGFFSILAFIPIETVGNDTLKEEAFKLINQGIDSSNYYSAIETILKIESDYKPANFKPIYEKPNPIYLKVFVFLIVLLVCSIIRPNTAIGLGKNKSKLKFYRFWIRLITITLPSLLIIGPFTKKIQELWTN